MGGGYLDRATVEGELLSAALAVGLGDNETAATIRSGLTAGEKGPWRYSDETPQAQTQTQTQKGDADPDNLPAVPQSKSAGSWGSFAG